MSLHFIADLLQSAVSQDLEWNIKLKYLTIS